VKIEDERLGMPDTPIIGTVGVSVKPKSESIARETSLSTTKGKGERMSNRFVFLVT
jgi:hypothetical protein